MFSIFKKHDTELNVYKINFLKLILDFEITFKYILKNYKTLILIESSQFNFMRFNSFIFLILHVLKKQID